MLALQSIGLKIGLAALIMTAAYGWHVLKVNQSHRAGQLSERLVWQERQAREVLKRDTERKQAQQTIDAIEREYWARQTNDAITMSDLEKALEQERADDKDPTGNCRPAVSKRVRDAIDAIGRD